MTFTNGEGGGGGGERCRDKDNLPKIGGHFVRPRDGSRGGGGGGGDLLLF